MPQFMTYRDVAEFVGVSPTAVFRAVQSSRLKRRAMPDGPSFRNEDVRDWLLTRGKTKIEEGKRDLALASKLG